MALSPTLWLTLPPTLTNHFHPEVGPAELAASLAAAGMTVRQRDLNVELVYGELTRGDRLAELARWVLRSAEEAAPPGRDPRRWRRLLLAAAARRGLGPPAGGGLRAFLEGERRRTNRSHRPATDWLSVRPPRLEDAALAGWPRAEREAAAAFVELCGDEGTRLWREVVEALQYLLLAPRSFRLSDVVGGAALPRPVLDAFVADRLDEMARFGGPPDLLGLSLHAQDQLVPALRLAAEARRRWPELLVVAGGPYCTAAWELLPAAAALFDWVDVFVHGSGHEPLRELAERRAEGRDLEGVAGTAVRSAARVVVTPKGPAPRLVDLTAPTFDELPLDLYPQRRLPLRLHEGCAWGRCRFCSHFAPAAHEAGAPPASAEHLDRVVAHARDLVERLSVSRFTLLDHAVPVSTLRAFAERVARSGLELEWDAMVRAEAAATAERCAGLRAGGGREVFLGVETVDPEGLRRLGKGATPELIDRTVDGYAGAGLLVRVFLLSSPGQDLDELGRAFDWALSRFPAVVDAMVSRFALGRGTRGWAERRALGLEVDAAPGEDPDLDVFHVPYRTEEEVPFEEYLRFFRAARARFQAARTAADLAAVPRGAAARRASPGPGGSLRVTLVGTGLEAAHARGESRRYNLATAMLQAAIQAHPDLGPRARVERLDLPFSLDAPVFGEEVVAEVLATSPDVLGLSCYAWDLEAQLALAAEVTARSPGTRVVLGGPSPTFGARAILEASPAVHAVVRGEGEETFTALLARGLDAPAGLPGVAYREPGGRVREEALGPPVRDLAALPSPLLEGVLEPPRDNLLLELSRGCPHRCRHCAWQTHGRGVRTVSEGRVEREVAWARERGVRHAFIIDSAVNHDDAWLEALTAAVLRADPAGEVVLSYFIDYRAVTAEQVRHLGELRAHEVLLGLESVSPAALRAAGRPARVAEAFARAVDLLADAVGPVTPNVMLGMPGDDLDGFRRTLDALASLGDGRSPGGRPRLRGARIHWAIVPPGSYFARNAARFGLEVHPRGVPYVLGSETFPRQDLLRALELVRDHPRADLFIWEDAEPARILGPDAPAMLAPGGGRVGGPAPGRIDDAAVLRAIAPLVPGREVRGYRVLPLGRSHGQPEVALRDGAGRTVRLQLRPRETLPSPMARTASFDLLAASEPESAEERALLAAIARLIEKNDAP